MPGTMTFDDLKSRVQTGDIDTVLACFVDMQGRLMGKRFHAVNFVEHSIEEPHCCNYLLATDLEMGTPRPPQPPARPPFPPRDVATASRTALGHGV